MPAGKLSRRRLARLLATGAVATLAPAAARPVAPRVRRSATPEAAAPAPPPLKPRHLQPGDTLGLVLPSSLAFEASTIELAREQLEAIGFRVKVGRHARARHGYFAGTDEQRAADLTSMFTDPEVKGIVCQRGGWGAPRLLPLLDYQLIARHPKVLLGYSDVTALLNAVHQRSGLVTFHGPTGGTNLRRYTLESLRRVLLSTDPIGVLANPEKEEDELVNRSYRVLTVAGGRAQGPLVGGNLTLLCALMGTPWEVDTRGAILLLEDVEEELYRVDRMLTQLAQGGKLAAAAGVAFGYCTDCPPGQGPSFSLEELLHEHLGRLGVPALAGLAFGHIGKMLTLPIGLPGTLDADAGTLAFDQAAVS